MGALTDSLAGKWSGISNYLRGVPAPVPAPAAAPSAAPGLPSPQELQSQLSPVWAAPAGFKAPGYRTDAAGGFYKTDDTGLSTGFQPTPAQLTQLQKAGMPMPTPQEAAPYEMPAPGATDFLDNNDKQKNVLGSENGKKVTNALAAALSASAANKPKVGQAQAATAGSVLKPENTLMELFAQSRVKRGAK